MKKHSYVGQRPSPAGHQPHPPNPNLTQLPSLPHSRRQDAGERAATRALASRHRQLPRERAHASLLLPFASAPVDEPRSRRCLPRRPSSPRGRRLPPAPQPRRSPSPGSRRRRPALLRRPELPSSQRRPAVAPPARPPRSPVALHGTGRLRPEQRCARPRPATPSPSAPPRPCCPSPLPLHLGSGGPPADALSPPPPAAQQRAAGSLSTAHGQRAVSPPVFARRPPSARSNARKGLSAACPSFLCRSCVSGRLRARPRDLTSEPCIRCPFSGAFDPRRPGSPSSSSTRTSSTSSSPTSTAAP